MYPSLQFAMPKPGEQGCCWGRHYFLQRWSKRVCASGKGSARPSSAAIGARHASTRRVAQAGGLWRRTSRARCHTAVHNQHALAKQRAHRSEGDQPRHATKARTAGYVRANLRACRGGLGRSRLRWPVQRGQLMLWARAKQGRPQRWERDALAREGENFWGGDPRQQTQPRLNSRKSNASRRGP